ncbi:hypothetical protein EJ03DRAFT_325736 [Teratosphaeria nubilosa]|uniref:Uncharacterized protein n=1 Tax=Teratosphaeria nubilosa TaxID=161662 RepID=A0A6G1LFF3_9PEZI|nr:hypothetical protein EJ03DRAFT_325736 [Teratosphaeria nubilosa]
MRSSLLPMALLTASAIATAPIPALFSIYEGTCSQLGQGLGSYAFDPYPQDTEISPCYNIPHGTQAR